jgi:uncharacterized Zn-binding protein involved in type VI secretion
LVGDLNSHGGGALETPPQTKFTVGGKLVATVDTVAAIDGLLHAPGATNAATGQSKWTIAGKAVHRHGDGRYCGASTIVTSQSTFSIG